MSLADYDLVPTQLVRRWAKRWEFQPTWQGMARAAEDRKHFPDGHRFPGDADEERLAIARCREAWSELTGAPRPRPPVQVVITYRLRFDDGDGSRIDTPVRPDLEDCSEEFGGEHWHSEPFGARFATPPLGWAHWYLTAGRYGWRRLEPLITKSVHRYPLNTLGGLLITAPDFSWVWHPYDGGSLVLNQAEQLP